MADAGHKKFGSKLLVARRPPRGDGRQRAGAQRAARVQLVRRGARLLSRAGLFGRPSAARAAFGMRFRDRRRLRRSAARQGGDGAPARRAQRLLDRAYRCDRSGGLQALSGRGLRGVQRVRRALSGARRPPGDRRRPGAQPHRGGGVSKLRRGAGVLSFARIPQGDRSARRQGRRSICSPSKAYDGRN